MTGANKFLGEVMLPLTSSALDLSNSKDIKYPLTVGFGLLTVGRLEFLEALMQ